MVKEPGETYQKTTKEVRESEAKEAKGTFILLLRPPASDRK